MIAQDNQASQKQLQYDEKETLERVCTPRKNLLYL